MAELAPTPTDLTMATTTATGTAATEATMPSRPQLVDIELPKKLSICVPPKKVLTPTKFTGTHITHSIHHPHPGGSGSLGGKIELLKIKESRFSRIAKLYAIGT